MPYLPNHASSSQPLPLLATTDLFKVSVALPFPECHVAGNMQRVTFWYTYFA